LLDGVQQIWLAGMGAVSKAQQDGPAAFQEAVAEGLKLLGKSRANAEKLVREVLESAQDSVQSRMGGVRDQAGETWDNLEALFQSRVQKALQQIGVPTADEVRLLTKRVAELNESVKALAGRGAVTTVPRAKRKAPARRAAAAKKARTARSRTRRS
jgi:poly(hydroxyalkanoate) granule-associated protein